MLNKTKEIKMLNQSIDCLGIVNEEESAEFIDKVNIGLHESAIGLVNTKEEAKLKLSKWL